MSKNVLRVGSRPIKILQYHSNLRAVDCVSEDKFYSVSQAIKETGIPRKKIIEALELGNGFIYNKSLYLAADLTPEEITELMERQQKDARERAKCTGHGQ